MNNMFEYAGLFNNGVTGVTGNNPLSWDTSGVKSMTYMFNNATAFNQDISNWNTSNVNDMSSMFDQAGAFNQPINTRTEAGITAGSTVVYWDTSSVTTFTFMFRGATGFNQNIGNWAVTESANLNYMFNNATKFNNGGATGDVGRPMNWSNVPNYHSTAPTQFSLNSQLTLWNGTDGNSPFTTTG
jgi:hypothetical protein